jgi:tetratricopeptide (TPR) repeat protein
LKVWNCQGWLVSTSWKQLLPLSASSILLVSLSRSTYAQATFNPSPSPADYQTPAREQTRGGSDPDSLLQQGTNALRANHCDEAILKFQAACAISPDFADAHHQWAIALVKAGRPQEAIEHFKLAIKIQPREAASWLSLGGAYQSAGDVKEAINAYNDYISHFPQDRDISKIRHLVSLLEKEVNNPPPPDIAAVATERPQSGIATQDTLSKWPKDTGASTDYFRAISKDGVIRWRYGQMPLRVWIEDGSGVPGYRLGFNAILRQAFLDWAHASKGAIRVSFVSSSQGAMITCNWSAQTEKFKNSAEAGESRLYSDRYGLAKGELTILTVPTSQTLPLTDNRLRAIALHEVGHLLGMAGHTNNPEDAMFNSVQVSESWRELSARDIATLAHLYGTD